MRPPGRGALLLTLTAAAGSADAVSYLGLQQVFTANMTGNLVLLGVAIGRGQLGGSIRSVIAFGAFGVGVLAGARLTTGTDRTGDWPRSITLALLVELSLLAAFAAGWELAGTGPVAPAIDILIALSAGAMGIQTAAARRLGVAGVTTTFVTGTLTTLLAELVSGVPNRPRVAQWAGTLACLAAGRSIPRSAARRHRDSCRVLAGSTTYAAGVWRRAPAVLSALRSPREPAAPPATAATPGPGPRPARPTKKQVKASHSCVRWFLDIEVPASRSIWASTGHGSCFD